RTSSPTRRSSETTLIVVAATVLALLLVALVLPVLNDWVQVPLSLRFDWLNLGFVGVLLFGTILLAGGYPAAVLSGFSPRLALGGSLASSGAGNLTVRKVLIVTQFAVCQVLIVGALVIANQISYI